MLDKPLPSSRHSGGEETRAALIAAATSIFLEEGFRAARVADIAKRSGLRLSAINYHFSGKEGLYWAVLQHHAQLAIRQKPLTSPLPQGSAHERLNFAIAALVERFFDPASPSRIAQLLLREMVNPTLAFDELLSRFSLPQFAILKEVVQEVVGPEVPDETLTHCVISIFGQCVAYVMARPLIQRMAPAVYADNDFMDGIVRHVSMFSWAGLQAVSGKKEAQS